MMKDWFVALLSTNREAVLEEWVRNIDDGHTARTREMMSRGELRLQCAGIIDNLTLFARSGVRDVSHSGSSELVDQLREISTSRAVQGFTPSDTASFVFSLKDAILPYLQSAESDAVRLVARVIEVNKLIDSMGILTFETYAATRESLIREQSVALAEMATPVVQVWDDVLVVPLIGALDSLRANALMENTLSRLAEDSARVAIVDITGVITVDTMVAHHLIKLASAVKLMGAEFILTGLSPTIARTIVQLGVNISALQTAASLAQGLKIAIKHVERTS